MNGRAAPTIRVLFLIRTAMTVGVATFIVVCWYLHGHAGIGTIPAARLGPLTKTMYGAVSLAAVVVMALRLRLAEATAAARRTLSIAGWAVGEFAAIFGAVLYLLGGEWRLVLPGAVVFAIALTAIPLPRPEDASS